MNVLVGTYRIENRDWIESRRLYNLPIADASEVDGLKRFEVIVLYHHGSDSPLAYSVSCVGGADRNTLVASGYQASSRAHGDYYALFMLREQLNAEEVLSNPAADVCVCSTRYTGKIDASFYSRPLPYCGGKSVPNIFAKLRQYADKWRTGVALNPVQLDFFSQLEELTSMKNLFSGKLTAVELFAGAGGLSIGLEKAGINVVIANEIMPDFAATLAANHPRTKVINDDIHNIDFKVELQKLGLESVDVLSGGPPCQGFSTIGSKNRKDPRNSLFYEYLRAVSETRPKYTIFENVSGFKRMYDGFAFKTLVKELDELGYDTCDGILNAADYGAPQVRYRTIVLGWRKDLPPLEMPKPTHGVGPGRKPYVTLMDAIGDLPQLGTGESVSRYDAEPTTAYQRKMRGKQTILLEHNAANYGEKMQEILRTIPEGGSIRDLPARLRPKSGYANTYARLLPNEPSPTITRNFGTPSSSRCVHPFQPRALSTREGARLQGFPDDYQFIGGKQSKNLQIGNAVPPILGEAIASAVKLALENTNE